MTTRAPVPKFDVPHHVKSVATFALETIPNANRSTTDSPTESIGPVGFNSSDLHPLSPHTLILQRFVHFHTLLARRTIGSLDEFIKTSVDCLANRMELCHGNIIPHFAPFPWIFQRLLSKSPHVRHLPRFNTHIPSERSWHVPLQERIKVISPVVTNRWYNTVRLDILANPEKRDKCYATRQVAYRTDSSRQPQCASRNCVAESEHFFE